MSKRYIDADALELEYRRMKDAESLGEHSGGYVYKRLLETLPPYWRKSSEDPPAREDGNAIGSVLAIGYHCNIRDGLRLANIMPWHVVRDNPEMFPLWMPLPKLPDLPVPERRCMMGND